MPIGACAGGSGVSGELTKVIEARRRVDEAFDTEIDRCEAVKSEFRKGEPTIKSSLGFAASLYLGRKECLSMFAREKQNRIRSANCA